MDVPDNLFCLRTGNSVLGGQVSAGLLFCSHFYLSGSVLLKVERAGRGNICVIISLIAVT